MIDGVFYVLRFASLSYWLAAFRFRHVRMLFELLLVVPH